MLLGLLAFHGHVVRQQVIHQLWILDHRPNGLKAAAILALSGDRQAIHQDLREPVGLDLADEFRVADLLGGATKIKIVEYREQDCCDQQPEQ